MQVASSSAARAVAAALVALALPATSPAQTPPTQAPAPAGAVRSLSLTDAVQLALEQNLGVRAERISPQIQQEAVLLAQAAWQPTFTSNFAYNSTDTPPDSFLSGAQQTLKSDFFQGTAGVQQLLPWGASYTFGWDGSRSTTNNFFSNFNPRLRSNLQISFVQPLMRNFRTDSSRTQLVVSRRNREISDTQLRATVVNTVRNVKNAYWDLKYAIANLDVRRQSLELARQTLKDNRTRVEVGTMAPIDIVEAEAEVARNEEAVILAEAQIRQAEDRLRALVFDPASPDFWTTTIEPVDEPQVQAVVADADAAIRAALDKRTDLQQARKQLEVLDANLRYYRDQMLPQVNLEAEYSATGLGGTQLIRGEGFPGPIIGETSRGFGKVLGDVYTFDYPAWTLGVRVSYPIGRSAAQASYARTRLQYDQGQLQIRNLELQVATQVRDAARQVNTNIKRIEATRAARVLAERRLEAEQKKFGVGMSTSFLVFQAQRDLATARVNELRAILDYNQSLADFEAVQEAAIGGGAGGGIGLAGAATTATTGATTGTTGTAGGQATGQGQVPIR
jgi:outer membrane protein TolC